MHWSGERAFPLCQLANVVASCVALTYAPDLLPAQKGTAIFYNAHTTRARCSARQAMRFYLEKQGEQSETALSSYSW